MLYTHQLKDLTPKSADIEAVHVIRELKTRTPLPLREADIREYFELFFVSESEKKIMAQALELIPAVIDEIYLLGSANDHDFEPVNNEDIKIAVEKLLKFREIYCRMFKVNNMLPFCSYDTKKVKEFVAPVRACMSNNTLSHT